MSYQSYAALACTQLPVNKSMPTPMSAMLHHGILAFFVTIEKVVRYTLYLCFDSIGSTLAHKILCAILHYTQ